MALSYGVAGAARSVTMGEPLESTVNDKTLRIVDPLIGDRLSNYRFSISDLSKA
jgi:hypothetical protein